MPLPGLRPYVQLASGLTGATAARAVSAARDIVPEELLTTGRNGLDVLVGLIRAEVDRTVSRLGLVPAEELDEVRAELATAQARLGRLELLVSELNATSRQSTASRPAKKSAARGSGTSRSGGTRRSTSRGAAAKDEK